MAQFPAVELFTDELGPQEFLLRGGCLKQPILCTDLEIAGGRKFFKLSVRDSTLRMFLKGQVKRQRSLALERLVDFLAGLRDQKQEEWIKVATAQGVPEDAVLDALQPSSPSSGDASVSSDRGSSAQTPDRLSAATRAADRLSAARKGALLSQFPVVCVAFPFGDEVLEMLVQTVRSKAEAPACEATPDNFRAFFCWYNIEAAKQVDDALDPKPSAIHEPEHHPEGRQYYRKDRACFYVKRSTPQDLDFNLTFVTKAAGPRGRPRKKACAATGSSSDALADDSRSSSQQRTSEDGNDINRNNSGEF